MTFSITRLQEEIAQSCAGGRSSWPYNWQVFSERLGSFPCLCITANTTLRPFVGFSFITSLHRFAKLLAGSPALAVPVESAGGLVS